jgi:hypothetical protein
MNPELVQVRYGVPKNVRNSPPTSAVPTMRKNLNESLTAEQKARIVDAVNAMRPPNRPVSWPLIEAQLMEAPPVGEMRFVYLDGAWRFDETGDNR